MQTSIPQPHTPDCIALGYRGLTRSGEQLKNGVWPQSLPLWMAAFYVALFIIRPWEQLFPLLGAIHFERVYALCMIAVVFFSRKKSQFHINSQDTSILLFLGALLLSCFFALNPSLAWDQLYIYLTIVVFYLILRLVIRTTYELVFIITCYIITMTIYLAKSQWEYFIHGQRIYDQGVYRLTGISGLFSGPNSLAMSIVVSLPFLLFVWSVRKEFSYGWPDFWRKWFIRLLPVYLVLAVSSIIMTNSRSGMVSFILFVFLVAFKGRGFGRKLCYLLLGMVILTVLWQVMPQEKKDRFHTIFHSEAGPASAQASAEGRIEGYKAGMKMFERFPFTGVGIGNFVEYRVQHIDGIALQPHNLVGQVLGETGLIGAMTFILMVIVVLRNCREVKVLSRGTSDPNLNALSGLSAACCNSILLLAFEGLFGHNLLRFNWVWLAAFSTLALQYARKNFEEKGIER